MNLKGSRGKTYKSKFFFPYNAKCTDGTRWRNSINMKSLIKLMAELSASTIVFL